MVDAGAKGLRAAMAEPKRKREQAQERRAMLREARKLAASTEEEVDALRVDLSQADKRPHTRDGSGRVVDELAEAEMAKFTEVGPFEPDRGAESLVPGRDDTSGRLWRHRPKTG